MLKRILLLVGFIFCISSSYAETIRFAEFSPNRGLRAKALQQFAQKLEKESNGELKIQFFWGDSSTIPKLIFCPQFNSNKFLATSIVYRLQWNSSNFGYNLLNLFVRLLLLVVKVFAHSLLN